MADAYRVATAFVHGQIDIDGDLLAAVRWWSASHVDGLRDWALSMLSRLRLESWFQAKDRARRNARFHYDRSNHFYEQFLDSRMVYSCAYFADRRWSLDEAQVAKLDYICHKLDLRTGDLFLDVGCGWGALLIHAAERFGASTVGCTLSAQQLAYARAAAAHRGLQGRVLVEDLDYRDVPGPFDKIASVGMYEHVGRRRLGRYFETLARLLEADGLLLNHGIARPEDARDDGSTVFLQRHVFPGGELPKLGDIVRSAERSGLEVLDVENLRPHYALTCAAWGGQSHGPSGRMPHPDRRDDLSHMAAVPRRRRRELRARPDGVVPDTPRKTVGACVAPSDAAAHVRGTVIPIVVGVSVNRASFRNNTRRG